MSFKTYKQFDSRWGEKNYNGSSTMATAGCGPTACATLISGIKASITPIDTMKYMQNHGYAIRNNGTAWAGIPACLKWGGYQAVHEVNTMSQLWDEMSHSKNCKGIILFTKDKNGKPASRGGVTWTTQGHYVPFTAYKKKNGKHYLWMRDPGPRNKEGWYCYEDHMKGFCKKVWTGELPQNTKVITRTTPVETDTTVDLSVGKTSLDKIREQAIKCSWAYGTAKKKYKYPSGKRKKAYVNALKKAFGARKGWRRQTKMGASCDVFVGAVVRTTYDKKFPRGCDDVLKYMSSKRGKTYWKTVSKKVPGCVIYQKYKSGAQHIMVYLGDGKVANAHYCKKTYPIIEKASKIIRKKSKCKKSKIYVPRKG